MKRDKTIIIKLTEKEKESVEKYCDDLGVNPGTYGRMLFLQKLNETKEDNK